ncbi:cation-translocating P-type ATPase [Candidatus Peregrinibacteria bacterium]|nr:cation-translocating P-type ATPase [Candidatus Peregrinibacteria bacterium]
MTENKIPYYQSSAESVFANLNTKPEGLNGKEVVQRLDIYGKNKLIAINKEPLIIKFLSQFKDLMAIILLVAAGLSIYMNSYRDAIILGAIIFINAVIGFFQEYKAERVMDSLKLLVKAKAKVIRNGKTIEIDGETVVPGDIVVLEEGDALPADLRIFEENNLATNDFSLTGESNPTKKFIHAIEGNVELGARNNLTFMGTTVAVGNGKGIVVATGMQTELGRIANLSQQTVAELSPLQKELNNLARSISFITLTIGAGLFSIGLMMNFSLRESFIFAMGIAAACVPEGLPAQVSVALSLAAGRLAQKKAVIKKLSAVETLGSTHIICTDKTGTLTTNEMTVQKLLIGSEEFDVTGIGYESIGEIQTPEGAIRESRLQALRPFFETGVFASNAKIGAPDKEHPSWYCIGDPTEGALITLAQKAGVDPAGLDKKFPELKEFTFDAIRKRMSSIRKRDGKFWLFAKGAPQSILSCCTHIWDGKNTRPITEKDRQAIRQKDDDCARLALRNLAYATCELPRFDPTITLKEAEQKLVWMGLVSMIDPPRKEVKGAIEAALKAFIRVIIITGDYALTAEAIAKKIGMGGQKKNAEITVVTGKELETMSDIELLHKLIYSNLIFARTSPEDKLRIVDLLKKAGEIVAVTGDGVNDAPALKKADIGVAMGKIGTDVAKESSELVLLDDSFGTLVTAIQEGRTIFQNLKKTILSSLTSNGGELFAVLLSLLGTALFGFPLAILAVQILAIDLVGEMLPLTFLTWDPAQTKIMSAPPRNPSDHIVNKFSLIDLAWSGFLMGALAYFNFLFFFFREGVSPLGIAATDPLYMRATTLTYISIVFAQWMNIMSRRAGEKDSAFASYFWSNKRLFVGFLISLFFLLNIVYNPWVSPFLSAAPMTLLDWGFAVLASVVFLLVREAYKVLTKSPKEYTHAVL